MRSVPPPLPSRDRERPPRPVVEYEEHGDGSTLRQRWDVVLATLREVRRTDGGSPPNVNAPSIHIVNHVAPILYVGGGRRERYQPPVVMNHGREGGRGNFYLGLAVILFVLFFVL